MYITLRVQWLAAGQSPVDVCLPLGSQILSESPFSRAAFVQLHASSLPQFNHIAVQQGWVYQSLDSEGLPSPWIGSASAIAAHQQDGRHAEAGYGNPLPESCSQYL